ncbi:MAG: TonB-dependent receptor [Candidatus Omnitrophica bacterium]|nr:TonB-dependent receptor [Candidatus Omnitrophota bacterium]
MRRALSLIILSVASPLPAFALEEPIVVTASRVEEPLERIGKSVSVISQDDIENEGSISIVESLRDVPGVRVQQLGAAGKLATIRIRGTRSFDTAVLLEGMPLRDPSDPQGSVTPFIEDLLVDDVDQIEVIRGGSSTLYGSRAMGGVINIRPRRGEAGPPRLSTRVEGGTHHTWRQTYQVSGAQAGLDYFTGYTRLTSKGLRENDGYSTDSYSGNLGYVPDPKLELRFLINADYADSDLNDSPQILGGVFNEDTNDPNDWRKTRLLHYSGLIRNRPSDSLEQVVRVGFVDTDRRFVRGVDAGDPVSDDSEFDGNTQNIEYQANVILSNAYSITLGGEYEREWLSQTVPPVEDHFNLYRYAAYLENRLSMLDENLNVSLGGRVGHHEAAHTYESAEGAASYSFDKTGTRLKGHAATGFREPSLFELFGRFTASDGTVFNFGNPGLKPERGTSWDAGLEQKLWSDSVKLTGTYFRYDYSKRILFRDAGYANVNGGHTRGVELEARWWPSDELSLFATYTRTDGRMDGGGLENVPHTYLTAGADIEFLERFKLTVDVVHKGDEPTRIFNLDNFTSDLFEAASYTKADARLAFDWTEDFGVWFRVENVFNQEIVESGFRNAGAAFYGGAKIEL